MVIEPEKAAKKFDILFDRIKKIIDNSSTILWNGPLGYFENENFSFGSLEVAKYIADKNGKIFSVIALLP